MIKIFTYQNIRRVSIYLLLLGAAYGLKLLYDYNPGTTSVFPPCPFHLLTGLYCPGCGSTRAMHQLLHGNIYAALRFNPLLVLCSPVLVYMIFVDYFPIVKGRRLPHISSTATSVKWILAVLILYAIFRNIPHYPFILLAPTD